MPNDTSIKRSMRDGRAEAERVLDHRRAARAQRKTKAVAVGRRALAAPPPRPSTKRIEALGGALTGGVLVAEGDSWFDYPWRDTLSVLEDAHGFDVESVAHMGDRVEDMAYSGGQLEQFTRRIEKTIRRGSIPRAILLSGGGNDIAGDDFAMLLNHRRSSQPGLNRAIVDGVIDVRLQNAYVSILAAVTTVCKALIGHPIPIIVHGYDYPVPDGRGFLGGWWVLPGPWLEPGFRVKGYDDLAERQEIIDTLIDRFNSMLATIAAVPGLEHVRYVDLRNTLKSGPGYKDWWANELHPTPRGFDLIAAKLVSAIARSKE